MSSTPSKAQSDEAASVDEAIDRMERLYQTMTGREAPPADTVYAPIPVERNPGEYVDDQMNRLLEQLGPSVAAPWAATSTAAWTPPLSLSEIGAEIVLRLDLPGVPRESLRVTMNGNVLTVSGSRSAIAPDGEALRLSEVPSGAFRRVAVLAGAARAAEPVARMKDGVLEIRVAREIPEPAVEKTVRIQ